MEKNSSLIYLKSVTNSDVKFLFDLLKERDPRANISHKNLSGGISAIHSAWKI